MRLLFVIFCACCLYTNVHAQTTTIPEVEKDSTLQTKSLDSIQIQKDSLVLNTPKDSIVNDSIIKKDWIAENWSTTQFNPYKDELASYPLHITFSDSTFVFPMKVRRVITSRYGWRRGRPHNGIDIDLITGDKVMAMFDGVVRYVRRHSGHGKTVVIRHYNGLETVYAHLSRQMVKANDTVVRGQVIGRGGTTGNARGSHLHLEMNFRGIPIHPEYLVDFSTEENKVRAKELWIPKKWTRAFRHNSRRKSNIEICTTFEEAKAADAKETKVYTVRRGDTLSKISNKYRVSISALCKANSIKRTSTLRIGQKLIVTH